MRDTNTSLETSYIDSLFGRVADPVLHDVRAAAASLGREGMMMSAAEANMLAGLVRLHGGTTIVEIGCFLGGAAIAMAHAIRHRAGARLITMEQSSDYAEAARAFISRSEVADIVELREGDATALLGELECQPDIVFIDANKAGYLEYARWALEHLPSGGLILADNSLLFGEACEDNYNKESNVSRAAWANMREMNAELAALGHGLSWFVPTPEGLTVAIKP